MTRRDEPLDFLKGIALLLGAHILAFIIGGLAVQLIFLIANVVPAPFNDSLNSIAALVVVSAIMGWGIVQLVYVIPLVIYLKRKRRYEFMKGVIAGAVITALLNGGCWLLLLSATR
jgi:hypothetical protein